MKLLIKQFSPFSYYSSSFGPNVFLSASYSRKCSAYVPPPAIEIKFHTTMSSNRQNFLSVYFNPYILWYRRQDKKCRKRIGSRHSANLLCSQFPHACSFNFLVSCQSYLNSATFTKVLFPILGLQFFPASCSLETNLYLVLSGSLAGKHNVWGSFYSASFLFDTELRSVNSKDDRSHLFFNSSWFIKQVQRGVLKESWNATTFFEVTLKIKCATQKSA
jgi:hypothetical protein